MPIAIRKFQPSDQLGVDALKANSAICILSFGDLKLPLAVATDGDVVVGCVWGSIEPPHDIDIFIAVPYRGLHLSRLLLSQVVDDFQLEGQTVAVTITNDSMQKLAGKLGLTPDDKGNWRGTIRRPTPTTG